MHRLRQSLPYFREFGWDPVVFAVEPDCVEGSRDPLLLETLPKDVPVHRVRALPSSLTRKAGLGNLGIRSWFSLRRAVDRYLRANPVDLIFFSTTVFTSIAHGPRWKRLSGAPFVVDLQDPWRNDYYLTLPTAERPAKFWFDYAQKKRLEAATMPHADGIVAVSSAYIDTMVERYPVLEGKPSRHITFGADRRDFNAADQLPEPTPPRRHPKSFRFLFAGVVPPSMEPTIVMFFEALRAAMMDREPLSPEIEILFVGTQYSQPQGPGPVTRLASQCAVEHWVSETVERRPYLEALKLMLDADALLVFGTMDTTYSASKIAPYVLSGKPVLALFHDESDAHMEFARLGFHAIRFNGRTGTEATRLEIVDALSYMLANRGSAPTRSVEAMSSYSAHDKTGLLAALFDEVVERRNKPPAAAPRPLATTA